MTTKYVRSSCQLHFTATADHASGDILIVNDTIGVAADAASTGDAAILGTSGTYGPFVCNSADVIVEGMDLYWDSTPGEFTIVGASGVYAGKAATPAAGGIVVVDVTFGLPEAA